MNVPFSEIKIGEKIGEGTFRIVYKGTFRGEDVCIKMLRHKESQNSWEKYISEINVLR
jgi:predicted Ser/Thr protein kinase